MNSLEFTITIVQLAQRGGLRYQKARDAMLAGKCGPTAWENRTLKATEAGVAAYLKGSGLPKVRVKV